MFPKLPLETQREIFKYLLPPPKVYHVRFGFSLANLEYAQPHLLPQGAPHTTLAVFIHQYRPAEHKALLKVCDSARSLVKDAYPKIELTSAGRTLVRKFPKETRADVGGLGTLGELWSTPDIVLNPDRGNDARMNIDLRPADDILIMNAEDLLMFYHYGGSIDMSRITQLALYDTPWQNRDYRNFHIDFPEHEILNHIQKYCPALKKLYITFPGYVTRYHAAYGDKFILRPELHGRFEHLDYLDRKGKELARRGDQHYRRVHDANILQARKMSDTFDKHLRRPEGEGWLDESTRYEFAAKKKFWEKVEVIPSSLCARLFTKSRKRNNRAVEDIMWNVDLPCHRDGTLLHKYKGLAQIFDGAPW
jgi:hypothetical protein